LTALAGSKERKGLGPELTSHQNSALTEPGYHMPALKHSGREDATRHIQRRGASSHSSSAPTTRRQPSPRGGHRSSACHQSCAHLSQRSTPNSAHVGAGVPFFTSFMELMSSTLRSPSVNRSGERLITALGHRLRYSAARPPIGKRETRAVYASQPAGLASWVTVGGGSQKGANRWGQDIRARIRIVRIETANHGPQPIPTYGACVLKSSGSCSTLYARADKRCSEASSKLIRTKNRFRRASSDDSGTGSSIPIGASCPHDEGTPWQAPKGTHGDKHTGDTRAAEKTSHKMAVRQKDDS
jgi:hypothetical protein